MAGVDPDADLLATVPVKSNLAWTLAYSFPVHCIAPDFVPDAPGDAPTYLAVYRDDDDKVGFLELNPVSAGLLDAIENNEQQMTGEELLRELATRANFADVDAFVGHGAAALAEMKKLNIVTGGRSPA